MALPVSARAGSGPHRHTATDTAVPGCLLAAHFISNSVPGNGSLLLGDAIYEIDHCTAFGPCSTRGITPSIG